MKPIKVVLINVAIIFFVLICIDPLFKLEEKDTEKIYTSLHLREFGPNRMVHLNPFGHVEDTTKLDRNYYLLETDDYGFICGPNDIKEEKPDIIFFGGSTTECAFVDDSLRFPYAVGQTLGVTSRNSGYGGNHSFHSLINLLGKGINNQPKMVVWMHNINDLTLMAKTGSYYDSPGNRRVLNEKVIDYVPSISKRLSDFKRSFINITIPNLYRKLSKLKSAKKKNTDEWEGFRENKYVDPENIKKEFKSALESFIGVARSHHLELVLMTQFNRIDKSNSDVVNSYNSKPQAMSFNSYQQLYHELNDIIKQSSVDHKLKLIDLDQYFKGKDELFYDAIHLNNAGSKQAAGFISQELDSLVHSW
jgi:hypothetical protein